MLFSFHFIEQINLYTQNSSIGENNMIYNNIIYSEIDKTENVWKSLLAVLYIYRKNIFI